MSTLRRAAAVVALALSACAGPPSTGQPATYIDLVFPVAHAEARNAYPHTVDRNGALWYVDDGTVVRSREPNVRQVVRYGTSRAGTIFWYDDAVYVLGGDGRALTKIDDRLHTSEVAIPQRFAPVEGAIADARHRAIVLAQASPRKMAVVDVWRWYDEPVPSGVNAFAASVAGGPHGKHYLVVGDRHSPLVGVRDRWNGRASLVGLPSNECFAGTGSALRVPVDVRGRDRDRAWVTTGSHVVSIDLARAQILRIWDVDGCAMQIVHADENAVTVVLARAADGAYESSLVRADPAGVHPLREYGTIAAFAPGALLDRYGRLWWFDGARHAFVCRTPVGQLRT